jgi:hypothetical protein
MRYCKYRLWSEILKDLVEPTRRERCTKAGPAAREAREPRVSESCQAHGQTSILDLAQATVWRRGKGLGFHDQQLFQGVILEEAIQDQGTVVARLDRDVAYVDQSW